MKRLLAAVVFLCAICVVGPTRGQDITEPKSGEKFPARDGDSALLGVGLRTKTVLKVKVYAIGFYVADGAIAGSLKGKANTPELYRELVAGDFKKKVVMKFVRDVSANQIRDAWRESLKGAGDKAEQWVNYFSDIRSGQECVIGWKPGVGIETKVAGTDKPVLNDKALATTIFGIWLGEKPIQEDLKKDLVARGRELLK